MFSNQMSVIKQSKIIDRNDEDIKNNGKETLCDVLTHIKNSTDTNENNIMGIEYSHPKMENNITLNIDNKYFVRNNDILDSIFILKYLCIESWWGINVKFISCSCNGKVRVPPDIVRC